MRWIWIIGAVMAVAGLAYVAIMSGRSSDLPPGIVSGNGRLEAVQTDISTKIPGRVKTITVQEGDLVKAGEVVATIDDAQLKAQLLRAQADVASSEGLVAQAEATIAQTKAQLILANRELARSAQLVEKGHVSREVHDTRISQRDVAEANLAAAEANLTTRQRAVDAARASVREIQTQIDDSVLTSPTLGRVLYRLAEPGEVLAAGGKVLTLINLSDIYMEIFLPAADAHRLALGSAARIVIDGTDFAIPAVVSFVSPEAQFTPKQVETQSEREKLMFRVKVRIPPELVDKYVEQVKTGVRGVAYVRPGLNPPEWPAWLQRRYEPPAKTSAIQSSGAEPSGVN